MSSSIIGITAGEPAGIGPELVALLAEDAAGRTLLPVGRRGRAAEAMGAGLTEQLSGLQHESGVRDQL